MEIYNPKILSAEEAAAQSRHDTMLRLQNNEERLIRMSGDHPGGREVLNALLREGRRDVIGMLDDDNIYGHDIWLLFGQCSSYDLQILIQTETEGRGTAELYACQGSSFYRGVKKGK